MATREHPKLLDSHLSAEQSPDAADTICFIDGKVDFHDPCAVREFTTSLLKRDFGIIVELPENRLCPPPSRYLYVQWIQDLVDSTNPSYFDEFTRGELGTKRHVSGLDIGTGASCIYTLLALCKRPEWFMSATDIDAFSLSYATKNIEANGFTANCNLLQTSPSDPLVPLEALNLERLDFTICNPPFFASVKEWKASISGEGKEKPPNSVCTGEEMEMVTDGGDIGFVLRILEESLILKDRVQWYTSMLGKLASATKLIERLKKLGCKNWAVCCLGAQHKTRRWAVGWSWSDIRPQTEVARRDMNTKDILPFPSNFTVPIPEITVKSAIDTINNTLIGLDLEWKWNEELQLGVGRARKNVWSRSARRKRKREETEEQLEHVTAKNDTRSNDVALGFMVSIKTDAVMIRWVQGLDQVIFESFCGMLIQALKRLAKT
ncbi:uncharacterized protein K452DRAFT_293397 [Aplosporella prunicola CBS 121167]|uniref:U6 small nuclear RNA (adenine-(43)-N(6))-methyltransferase n=1 Tax=Aplosporella prunicola CBS 121167 TaxID=1176127 RepID=A0A6A6AVI1_9PEZI|nr:uncharacterized protein K452DRAFT_293397 [Aplosporella prunicola CBS 121167]KAF2135203.1 hypothetical protein K452DRAFT_293397 [Aplosporella prunicola CBS 121167]